METEFEIKEQLPAMTASASGWASSAEALRAGVRRRDESGWRRRHWRNLPRDMDQGLAAGMIVGLIAGCLIGYFTFYELGFEAGFEEARDRLLKTRGL